MKRFICAIIACVLIVLGGVPCYAQSVDSDVYGIKFELSDSWFPVPTGEYDVFLYSHLTYPDTLQIEVYEANPPVPIEMLGQDVMDEIFAEAYTAENIAANISTANGGIDVDVEVLDGYGNIAVTDSGNTVYVYLTAYIARAEGYEAMYEQDVCYCLIENGKQYFITYTADENGYGLQDVIDMVNSMTFANDYIEIYIDNEQVFPDSAPMLVNDRTLVPIRAIAEYMGYNVEWDGDNRKVTITDDETTLEFIIGSNVAYKNSTEEIELDVPADIYSDRTYLPLRAVAEALEADVKWDGDEKAVNIRLQMTGDE